VIRNLTLTLLLTLPTLAFAIDLEGYYITAKGGISKSMDTGVTDIINTTPTVFFLDDNDLGTGWAGGLSVGKYLTNKFRMELEFTRRGGLEYNALSSDPSNAFYEKAHISSNALFVNGLYDFQPFSVKSSSITPYIGGGIGIARNKMGMQKEISANSGQLYNTWNSNSISSLAYKLSVGTLVSFTEKVSLDLNYQYVNLGDFKGRVDSNSGYIYTRGIHGGEIKTQELMVGLQYTFK
jgi:opacity protein-like surface antigen